MFLYYKSPGVLQTRPFVVLLRRKPFPFDFRKKAALQSTVTITRRIYYSRANLPYSDENIQFSLLSHGNFKRTLHLRRSITLHKKPELTPFIHFEQGIVRMFFLP